MSIKIKLEKLRTFSEAAASLPKKPAVSTIHRWRLRGCRGVKLESTHIGGVRYTSDEALQRFFDRYFVLPHLKLESLAAWVSIEPTRRRFDEERTQAV
jgi:hypothetical protein